MDDLLDKLEESIRVTLVVSDRHGFDLVKSMISGINFNKTVCNVIVKPDGTESDIKELHEKYITKCER